MGHKGFCCLLYLSVTVVTEVCTGCAPAPRRKQQPQNRPRHPYNKSVRCHYQIIADSNGQSPYEQKSKIEKSYQIIYKRTEIQGYLFTNRNNGVMNFDHE